jgi:orotate phosphoribosyltransferase
MDKEKYFIEGKFMGSSGKVLDGYYDFRPLLLDWNFTRNIMVEVMGLLPSELHWISMSVVGVELWGACIVTKLAGGISFNPIIYRKSRNHGLGKTFYGDFIKGYTTIILDDVITTGNTVKRCIEHFPGNQEIDYICCMKNRSGLKHVYHVEIMELFA